MSEQAKPHHLWGGRFVRGTAAAAVAVSGEGTGATSTTTGDDADGVGDSGEHVMALALQKLNCSLPYDARLYAVDIDVSKAYAEALQRAGLLTIADCERIVKGFELVRYDWIEGLQRPLPSDEDVHTLNERRLIELIGEPGERLAAGRSRNDQVATDMHLWLRKGVRDLVRSLRALMQAAVRQAEAHGDTLMPGYTHLQRAQPVRFAHWLLSHVWALHEDCRRLLELRRRANVMPLGSGALAGNPLGIDRAWLAQRLGFDRVTQNSMHAVGDRDYVMDFVYCCSLISLHLSRWAEDLIIYTSQEFDFVRLADGYATGSSLMPQKRNPDSLELVRGLSANITSALLGLMMTVKATPSTYNKDYQFDKQYCFDAFDRVQQALSVMQGVTTTMQVQRHQCESALSGDMLATDWAIYLVRKGVPFRQAHRYIGQIVAYAEEHSEDITEIPLGELQKICPKIQRDIAQVCDYGTNVEQYNAIGGTAKEAVAQQIETLRHHIKSLRKYE